MQISGNRIDDFKIDRKDIMPPLPMIFRLVPILFYLSLVYCAVIGSVSFWHLRVATNLRDETRLRGQQVQQSIASTKAARAALEEKIRVATNLESWVMASMPLQPLVVAIIRSMSPQTDLVDLIIERDVETPSQLKLAMRMNTDSDEQLAKTLEVIKSMDYREVSPTQTMERGELSYRASLVWQNPGEGGITPEQRGKEVVAP
jgi:hypothetical protein